MSKESMKAFAEISQTLSLLNGQIRKYCEANPGRTFQIDSVVSSSPVNNPIILAFECAKDP